MEFTAYETVARWAESFSSTGFRPVDDRPRKLALLEQFCASRRRRPRHHGGQGPGRPRRQERLPAGAGGLGQGPPRHRPAAARRREHHPGLLHEERLPGDDQALPGRVSRGARRERRRAADQHGPQLPRPGRVHLGRGTSAPTASRTGGPTPWPAPWPTSASAGATGWPCLMANCPEIMEAMFAAWKLGAAVVPLNARFTADEIDYHVNDPRAKAMIVGPENAELVPGDAGPAADRRARHRGGRQGAGRPGARRPHRRLLRQAVPGRRRRARRAGLAGLHVGHHRPAQGRHADPRGARLRVARRAGRLDAARRGGRRHARRAPHPRLGPQRAGLHHEGLQPGASTSPRASTWSCSWSRCRSTGSTPCSWCRP